MITNMLPAIDLNNSQSQIFDRFVETANIFCDYLSQAEGIRANGLTEYQYEFVKERFLKLPEVVQLKKLANFEVYYNICREITKRRRSLKDKVYCLQAFLEKYSLTIPDESDVLSTIDKDTYVEIYDNCFTQVFRSADFMQVTGHSLMALESCEWFDLFERSKDLTADQVEVVTKIFDGKIKVPIFKPIEDHSVKEINSQNPRNSQAEIILYSPIFGADGLFHGILHIFRVKETRQLDFQVV